MELVRVQDSDYRKAYELYMSFPENENGYMNNVYGYSAVDAGDLWKSFIFMEGTKGAIKVVSESIRLGIVESISLGLVES